MSGAATVCPLHGNQMAAVDPLDTVWLSASAGTGKTQVLSSRVLRLLLQPGVEPSQVLCLTFTKAGATEMAARINGTLAQWVRLSDIELVRPARCHRRADGRCHQGAGAHAVCRRAGFARRRSAHRYDPRLFAVAAGNISAGSRSYSRQPPDGGPRARSAGAAGSGRPAFGCRSRSVWRSRIAAKRWRAFSAAWS